MANKKYPSKATTGKAESETTYKKSGCKYINPKDGSPYMYFWNASKSGIISGIAGLKKEKTLKGQAQKTQCVTDDGEVREIWLVKLKVSKFDTKLYTGFFDPVTKVLRIPDIQMTANPSVKIEGVTRRGKRATGYFGTSVVRS